MAHTHYEHLAQVNPKPGIFPLYVKIDFSKQPMGTTAGDYFVLAKILHNWIVLDSYWKIPTDSTDAVTVDIGTTYNGSGQEIVAGADLDAGTQTTWTQGAVKSGAIDIHAKDTYLTVEVIEAVGITTGVLEILLLVAAGVDESAPADRVAVTS
jgi:hypothetical protein